MKAGGPQHAGTATPQGLLFPEEAPPAPRTPELPAPEGLWCGRGFLLQGDLPAEIVTQVEAITQASPWRRMRVPGGGEMSVAMSNCGVVGWVADESGYRYSPTDPLTGRPWPELPAAWRTLARQAATAVGHPQFDPDVCLINRYEPGARMGLHRDSDEADLRHPIVSFSLGASAVFLWGGLRRRDPVRRLPLHEGDVLVWGGAHRLTYHGVAPLRPEGQQQVRLNLTFRRALAR